MTDKPQGFNTRAIHAGYSAEATTGACQVPIYQTSAFQFENAEDAADKFALKKFGNVYSRLTNPTNSVLEARLASLEGGTGATITASGHAAQMVALAALMRPGDHFVASHRLYGGTINQFKNTFPTSFGWQCSLVDIDDPENVRKAILPNTKAVYLESLSNPMGVIADLEAIAKIAHEAGVPLIVDNTMATSYLCRPFEWGADIVLYSTTKFLSGTGSTVGGAIIEGGKFNWAASDKFPALTQADPSYNGLNFYETFGDMAFTVHGHGIGLRDLGPTQSPFHSFLTLLSLETLGLRMQRHCDNALAVAKHLASHPDVSWVSYSGLPDSKYAALAKKYLTHGAGAVFTFGVKGGFEAAKTFVSSMKLFAHVANIGDARSLVIHPASTTHSQLSEEHRVRAGASPEMVRLSIGLEDVADIIGDIDQALAQAKGMAKAA